jgi:tetratricopeptide (TPR) repeat protein
LQVRNSIEPTTRRTFFETFPNRLLEQLLANINSKDCDARVSTDHESNHQAIEQYVGFKKLDSIVFECIRGWVILATQRELDRLQSQATQNPSHDNLLLVARVQRSLASVFRHQGMYEAAQELLYYVVHNTQCMILGENHQESLKTLNDIVINHRNLGHILIACDKSIECHEKRKTLLGKDAKETLSSLSLLASLFIHRGKCEVAEEYLKNCLEEDKLDTNNNVLKNDLAYCYTKQGKFALAKPLYLGCIEWRTKKFGKDDPRTVLSRHNLAGLYRDSGEYEEAEKLDKECYESRLRTLGAENPSTLSSMSALADTYVCLKIYGLAETQAKECLQIRRRIIGPKHPAIFLT